VFVSVSIGTRNVKIHKEMRELYSKIKQHIFIAHSAVMAHGLSTFAYNVLTCCVILCVEFMPFKFSVNITLFYLFVCFTNLWFCL